MTQVLSGRLNRRLKRQQRKDPRLRELTQRYGGGDVARLCEPFADAIDIRSVKQGRLQAEGESLTLTLQSQRDLATEVAVSLTHGPGGVALKRVTRRQAGEDRESVRVRESRYDARGEETSSLLHSRTRQKGRTEADLTLLTVREQGRGGARETMRSLLEEWDEHEVREVDITAVSVGSYAWLKFGFAPSLESWKKLGQEVDARAERLDVSPRVRAEIDKMTDSSDPRDAWRIADLQQRVTTEDGEQSLGQALLLDQAWSGALDLADPASRKRLERYLA